MEDNLKDETTVTIKLDENAEKNIRQAVESIEKTAGQLKEINNSLLEATQLLAEVLNGAFKAV